MTVPKTTTSTRNNPFSSSVGSQSLYRVWTGWSYLSLFADFQEINSKNKSQKQVAPAFKALTAAKILLSRMHLFLVSSILDICIFWNSTSISLINLTHTIKALKQLIISEILIKQQFFKMRFCFCFFFLNCTYYNSYKMNNSWGL